MNEEIQALFDKHGDKEYLEFDRIPVGDRRHPRPDLCAFLYLHERFGGTGDAISGAEHDEIYLDWDDAELTDDDVIYLSRCGVRCGEYGLCMFV